MKQMVRESARNRSSGAVHDLLAMRRSNRAYHAQAAPGRDDFPYYRSAILYPGDAMQAGRNLLPRPGSAMER